MYAYSKGLHILCEIQTSQITPLRDFMEVRNLLLALIQQYALHSIGEVFHNFEGGGYTGMICLTESHISIHTWPEFGRATYDVFLSNYERNNEHIVRAFHQELMVFFGPNDVHLTEIYR